MNRTFAEHPENRTKRDYIHSYYYQNHILTKRICIPKNTKKNDTIFKKPKKIFTFSHFPRPEFVVLLVLATNYINQTDILIYWMETKEGTKKRDN